jgi:hypothetical protein
MKGDVFLLNQLISSMEEAVNKIETAKDSNDLTSFNKLKNFILDLQKRIDNETNSII